ncbi:MAG: hypothetical protein AAB667_00635 [Patescibacteria group bacterium]
MSQYEIYSLIIQGITVVAASVFAVWQIFINRRLKKLNDFVAVAIVPNPEGANIKLLNTGKVNLYIHGFEINGTAKLFDKGRLLSAASLDSAYYWLPTDNVPHSGTFAIKVWLTDEFDKKYVTLGQGESIKRDGDKIEVRLWTFKTHKEKWEFSNIN